MRLTIGQAELRAALECVAPALKSGAVPAFTHILIEAGPDSADFLGGDLELTIRTTRRCAVSQPGALAFPGAALRNLVRTLPAGPVVISSHDRVGVIEAGYCRAELPCLDATEFPRPSKVEYSGGRIPGRMIQFIADHVAFAAASDEGAAEVLRGVLLRFQAGDLEACATDGRRLALAQTSLNGAHINPVDAVVAPKVLECVRKAVAAVDAVELGRTAGSHRIGFRTKESEVVTAIIRGAYPDFAHILNQDPKTMVVIQREALMDEISRLVLLANDRTHRVELHLDAGRIHFRAADSGRGAIQSEAAVEMKGPGLKVAVNGKYLLDCLARFPLDLVELGFTDAVRAIRLRPAKDAVAGWHLVNILMPLRPHG
jgi:DNA polymerase III subunit beta